MCRNQCPLIKLNSNFRRSCFDYFSIGRGGFVRAVSQRVRLLSQSGNERRSPRQQRIREDDDEEEEEAVTERSLRLSKRQKTGGTLNQNEPSSPRAARKERIRDDDEKSDEDEEQLFSQDENDGEEDATRGKMFFVQVEGFSYVS